MTVKLKHVVVYSVIFIIIILISGYAFISQGLTIIWNADAVGQYYPALVYMGEYIRNVAVHFLHGNFSLPVYDLSIGMGENIIGCLNYYGFGDPFNLLTIFVTKDNAPITYTIIYVLRLYLAGIAAMVYCNEVKLDGWAAVLGAITYVFSGFGIYGGIMYIEWLSVLFYFPLIIAGAESFIRAEKKRPLLFILSIAYGAVCGFYYLFMSSIALGGYCILRLLFKNGVKNIRESLKAILILLALYILGIGISSPIFVFATRAFLQSERNGNVADIIFDKSLYKPNLGLLRDFFMCSIKVTQSYAMGIGIVQWLVIFISLFLKNTRRRVQMKVGFFICLFIISLPISYWFFNGFGNNYSRWLFLVQFFFMIIFVSTLGDIIKWIQGRCAERILIPWTAYAFIGVMIGINVVRNVWGLMLPSGMNWGAEYIKVEDAGKYVTSPVANSSTIMSDNGLFRVSNDTFLTVIGRPENTAMINDYYGLTYFFSIVNKSVSDYLLINRGYEIQERSFGFDNNIATEAASGTKYYVAKEEKKDSEYIDVEVIDYYDSEWYVYSNPYYKGFAYFLSEDSGEYSESDGSLEEYNKKLLSGVKTDSLSDISFDNYSGTFSCITKGDAGKLIIALPYDNIWEAYVDGVNVKPEKFNMHLAVNVGEGRHVIKVIYSKKANYLLWGIAIISLIVAFVFGMKWYIQKADNDSYSSHK